MKSLKTDKMYEEICATRIDFEQKIEYNTIDLIEIYHSLCRMYHMESKTGIKCMFRTDDSLPEEEWRRSKHAFSI